MMGADFLEKSKKPFRKYLDRSRVKLTTPTLFSVQPELKGRTLRAEPLSNYELEIGQKLSLELRDGRIVARVGLAAVARLTDPPSTVLDHFAAHDVLMSAEVSEINDFCGTMGVRIAADN